MLQVGATWNNESAGFQPTLPCEELTEDSCYLEIPSEIWHSYMKRADSIGCNAADLMRLELSAALGRYV